MSYSRIKILKDMLRDIQINGHVNVQGPGKDDNKNGAKFFFYFS